MKETCTVKMKSVNENMKEASKVKVEVSKLKHERNLHCKI